MAALDRLSALIKQDEVTGIDFVYVHPGQTTLDVFFLKSPLELKVKLTNLTDDQVRISAAGQPDIPVAISGWPTLDGRPVLRLNAARPRISSICCRTPPTMADQTDCGSR